MTSALAIARAARCVRAGGLIAYPTEAVYGLGCLPDAADTISRLLALKRRSWRKGLLLIGASLEQIAPFAMLPEEGARRREILASWPGPVTWILPARRGVARLLTGGRETLGVRVTDHPTAAALCAAAGSALVSTSANVSTRPPARSALQVRRTLGAGVDWVLAGAVGGLAKPTLIKDGRTGRVLRAA